MVKLVGFAVAPRRVFRKHTRNSSGSKCTVHSRTPSVLDLFPIFSISKLCHLVGGDASSRKTIGRIVHQLMNFLPKISHSFGFSPNVPWVTVLEESGEKGKQFPTIHPHLMENNVLKRHCVVMCRVKFNCNFHVDSVCGLPTLHHPMFKVLNCRNLFATQVRPSFRILLRTPPTIHIPQQTEKTSWRRFCDLQNPQYCGVSNAFLVPS